MLQVLKFIVWFARCLLFYRDQDSGLNCGQRIELRHWLRSSIVPETPMQGLKEIHAFLK